MKKNSKWTYLFLLFFAFILTIIVLAYLDRLPEFIGDLPDFYGHMILYGLLAEFLHLAIRRKHLYYIPVAPILVFLFSLGDEFLQKLSQERTFSLHDLYGNIIGIGGLYLLDSAYRKLRKTEKDISVFEDIKNFSLFTKSKTAIVFGATGLVGSKLVDLLSKDDRYDRILVFNRRNMIYESDKIQQHHFDLEEIDRISHLIKGDDLFCCLGSTMKKAGSKEAFEFVDYVIPVRLARVANDNDIKSFITISSLGANRITGNFYLNVKGKMERGIQQFNINNVAVFRPSLILGQRNKKRFGETVAKIFMKIFSPFLIGPLKKYRPIEAESIARAMIVIANYRGSKFCYESDEIQLLNRMASL